jgi:hypothetical protein
MSERQKCGEDLLTPNQGGTWETRTGNQTSRACDKESILLAKPSTFLYISGLESVNVFKEDKKQTSREST